MMLALAIKELREVRGIAAIALGFHLAVVSNLVGLGLFSWVPLIPQERAEVPFAGSSYVFFFGIVSGLFALALGFRQSAWESARGTYLFLLHRPLSRSAIFLTKLGIGIAVFLVCAGVPVLLYAFWAAAAGNHPSPFEWSMTGQSWRLWFLLPLIYLGAFLSGLRPARWFGTRLLPLATCSLLVALLMLIPWWRTLGLPLALVLDGLLVVSITDVARTRDYS
jgi:ABC-type transport system involved in multi-copper enzyme maturation permease subunit